MARLARQLSQTGLYHIIFRGVDSQHIFEDDLDYQKVIDILALLKTEMKFEIFAYCFMSNHVHILMKERDLGDISLIMKRLLAKYARWYNTKYSRSGTLIANRYKSYPVEIDSYFLSVIRYIHQNPVKAKMVNDISEYKWSSYNEYAEDKNGITDKKFVYKMLKIENFKAFHEIEEKEIFSVNDKVRMADEGIRREIIKLIKMEPKQVGSLDRKRRNEILKELKTKFSIRQIERITGVSRGIVANVDK